VETLRYEVPLDELPGFRADAVLGDTVFEVLVDPRDLRRLRASLIDVARISSSDRWSRVILILDEPRISEERLREEWEATFSLFRPGILESLTLVIRREDEPDEVMGQLTEQERGSIEGVTKHVRQHALRPMKRPSEAFFDILRVLLIHWVRKSGPQTSKALREQTGFSYPTLARALERLEPNLLRHSDRRVELRSFPRDAWLKLVSQSEKVRSSQGYVDRSGRPRPAEVLLDRLRELSRRDIGVSGVLGARHYVPGLDLIGTPRLDLVVQHRRQAEPAKFLRRLDPALKPAQRGESPQVVVHTLYRPDPFFNVDEKGHYWADEIECLLDLHEIRLEPQALEFIDRLTPKPKP